MKFTTALTRIFAGFGLLFALQGDRMALGQLTQAQLAQGQLTQEQLSLGESSFVEVRVNTSSQGPTYYVDNVPYTTSQIFRWQVGDVHTVRTIASQDGVIGSSGGLENDSNLGTRYLLAAQPAIDPVPPTGAVQLSSTASDGRTEYVLRIQVWSFLKTVTLGFVKQHRLRFVTPGAGCAPTNFETLPGACGNVAGYTEVRCGSAAPVLATTSDIWCGEGPVELTSVPAVGYAFKDWNTNPGLTYSSTAGVYGSAKFNLISPFTVQVNFGPGKFYRVSTEPAGLDVVLDRSVVRTSAPESRMQDLCSLYGSIGGINIGQGGDGGGTNSCVIWLVGSTRLLAAPELQQDKFGVKWVFDQWSTGNGANRGGQNTLFEVSGDNLATDSLVGRFLRAGGVTFVTQPKLNLPLIVNNRTWPAYNFWFGMNKEIAFSAPLESVDPGGRRWRFKGWSNGGAAAQTLKIGQDIVDNGLYLIAQYEPMNKLSIETNPPGLPVVVDGVECKTPCLVEKLATDTASVSPARSITQADVLRLEFTNWTDGGAADRAVNFEPELRRIVANYRQLYRLSTLSNPAGGASFALSPDSPDGFYNLDTRVTVTAKAVNGFKFRRWSGDTAGLFPAASLTVGGPRTVVAELTTVPFLDPAGIKNSAGTGPQDEGVTGKVAAGSLITIYGANLTTLTEIGPRSPLPQTLAGIVARVNERFLPLSFASPNQINAQLPYDLAPGRYTLTLMRTGQPDTSADFEVVQNAPGLFGQSGTETEGQPALAFAFRSDGGVVSEEFPAKPNEIIQLTGTGIGPYRFNPPLGFAIPAGNEFVLSGSVEVLAGDEVIQPLKVIGTPGFVGMTSIHIRVGSQFKIGESTNVRIRINGKESNTVRIFVR